MKTKAAWAANGVNPEMATPFLLLITSGYCRCYIEAYINIAQFICTDDDIVHIH